MAIGRIVVRVSHAGLGGTGSNTWHFRSDGAWAAASAAFESVSDVVKGFYQDADAAQPDAAGNTFDGVITGVGADEGESFSVPNWSVPGAVPGGILPPFTCICFNWKTESGGRSGMGRTFLGPISKETLELNGTLSGDSISQMRAAGNDLVLSSIGLTGSALGVWSPQDGLLRDFTSATVRDQYAVLRSRRD